MTEMHRMPLAVAKLGLAAMQQAKNSLH